MPDFVTSTDGTAIAYDSAGNGPALVLVGGALSTRASDGPRVATVPDEGHAVRFAALVPVLVPFLEP